MEERLQREGKEKEEEIEATRLKAEEMEHEDKKWRPQRPRDSRRCLRGRKR